jgi:hypothetical protein
MCVYVFVFFCVGLDDCVWVSECVGERERE